MQAGVKLTANGRKCARIKAGEEFELTCEATLPEGSGEITSVCYDFNDIWHYSGEERQNVFPIEGSFTLTIAPGLSAGRLIALRKIIGFGSAGPESCFKLLPVPCEICDRIPVYSAPFS